MRSILGIFPLVLLAGLPPGCWPDDGGPNLPVEVLSPNGGECWRVGRIQTIYWRSEGAETVRIELSRDGGSTWLELASSTPASTGVYAWQAATPDSTNCVVRVSDTADETATDTSDRAFEIATASLGLTAPDGGESWPVGSAQGIAWESKCVDSVRVELSRDAGENWEELAAVVDAKVGSFSLTVDAGGNALPQRRCVVRLTDTSDPGLVASSGELRIWSGSVHHVDLEAADGGDGAGWASAFRRPQDALDVASAGDEVWIAAGTYVRRGASDTVLLTMKNGVDVYGGFSGTETCRDARDLDASESVLDGEDLCYHVVVGASNAVLDGVIVTRGNAPFEADPRHGGGMYNESVSDLRIARCRFEGNSVYDNGGGMYCGDAANLVIVDCDFLNNSAPHLGFGAGVYLGYSTNVTVRNCVFDGNAANWSGSGGGGMYNQWTSSQVVNCVFANNTSPWGAGMVNNSCSPVVVNCTFAGNSASNHGGAVASQTSYPDVTNCVFWNNWSPEGPDIYDSSAGLSAVTYCCIQQPGYAGSDGNIEGDPMFVGVDDYRLQPDSPCVDSGTPDGAPGEDIEGNERPWGSGYDMGAYEYRP